MLKAFVTANFTSKGLDRLRQHMEVVYEPWGQTQKLYLAEDLASRLKELAADVLILEVDLCHEEVFEACELKLIGCCRGDPLNVDLELATQKGVPVLFTPGRNAAAVADLTVTMMLAQLRQLIPIHNLLASGKFNPEDPGEFMALFQKMTGLEMGGQTVGIIGLGAIGQAVAVRARAFGSRVLAYDPFVDPKNAAAVELTDLDTLLRESDLVTIHVPLLDQTQGMIGARELSLMKPTAFFFNLARAGLIVQDALYQALKEKRIAGAGIDVFPTEPPPPDERLLFLDNVIVTPHIAGATHDVVRHQTDMVLNDLLAWLRGERPIPLANPEVWDRRP
jgi:D-3-phosphoglycerate dehydrogenase